MDLAPMIAGGEYLTWREQLWVSLLFGAAVLSIAYLVDRRTKEDYSFWLYLFGVIAFWGGLSLMESSSEFKRFLYCLINVGLMFMAVLLRRKVFMVFGSLGVFGYLGHLAWSVFEDSMMFPFVLTLIGIFIMYLGVQYQRNEERIIQNALSIIPQEIKNLLPMERTTSDA